MCKTECVEWLYIILRVFGQEPEENQLDWKLSSLGKAVCNFAKYQIPVSTSGTGGRIICYEYLVEETTQKKQPGQQQPKMQMSLICESLERKFC